MDSVHNVPYVVSHIRHVLPQRVSWVFAIGGPPHFVNNAYGLSKEAAALALQADSPACGRQILAG